MVTNLQLPDISEEEKTPAVLLLLEIIENQNIAIQQLKDEVARLKGNPTKPKLKPSKTIELDKAANKKQSRNSKKKRTGRRSGRR